jgi:hypothetical protein
LLIALSMAALGALIGVIVTLVREGRENIQNWNMMGVGLGITFALLIPILVGLVFTCRAGTGLNGLCKTLVGSEPLVYGRVPNRGNIPYSLSPVGIYPP